MSKKQRGNWWRKYPERKNRNYFFDNFDGIFWLFNNNNLSKNIFLHFLHLFWLNCNYLCYTTMFSSEWVSESNMNIVINTERFIIFFFICSKCLFTLYVYTACTLFINNLLYRSIIKYYEAILYNPLINCQWTAECVYGVNIYFL